MIAHPTFPYFKSKVRCFKKEICGYVGNIVIKWKRLQNISICQAKLKTFADLKYINICTVRKGNISQDELKFQMLKRRKKKRFRNINEGTSWR